MNPRVLLFCALLSVAVSSFAQPLWELGAREFGKGPGVNESAYTPLGAAASRGGHLVAWKQGQGLLTEGVASRVTSTGEVLDPTGINLGIIGEYGSTVIGSDGAGYLVANWSAYSFIDDRGTLTQTPSIVSTTPWALSWNGSVYLLVGYTYASPPGTFAILVDRKGQPVSGRIYFPDVHNQEITAASFNGSWVVTWCKQYTSSYGVPAAAFGVPLNEAMFPPIGEKRVLAQQLLFTNTNSIAIAADAQGYVVARNGMLQRLDAASLFASASIYSGRTPGRRTLDSQTVAPDPVPIPNCRTYDGLAIEGSTAFVTCRDGDGKLTAQVYRIANGQVHKMLEPSRARWATLSLSSAAPLAAWIDAKDNQVYAAPARGSIWSSETHLLSGAFASQRGPTIASARDVHLAAWMENRAGQSPQLTITVLSSDGRPTTSPMSLGDVDEARYGLASDGSSFLVTWARRSAIYGAIVRSDGTIAHGPYYYTNIDYGPEPYFVSWDGEFYDIALGDDLLRIKRDGMIERHYEARSRDFGPSYLFSEGSGFLAIDRGEIEFGCLCGTTVSWEIRFFDRDLTQLDRNPWDVSCDDPPVGPPGDPWFNKTFRIYTWRPSSAIAVGGGHRILVARGSNDNDVHVIGDDAEIRDVNYGSRHYANDFGPWRAVWTGSGFAVSAGSVLAMHASDGRLQELRSLPPETTQNAVGINADGSLLVLAERRVGTSHRIAAFHCAINDCTSHTPRGTSDSQ